MILGATLLLLLFYFVSNYNGLVSLDAESSNQWAQVETQYQRRLDLIPNLVEATKGMMSQEKEVFSAIAKARTIAYP